MKDTSFCDSMDITEILVNFLWILVYSFKYYFFLWAKQQQWSLFPHYILPTTFNFLSTVRNMVTDEPLVTIILWSSLPFCNLKLTVLVGQFTEKKISFGAYLSCSDVFKYVHSYCFHMYVLKIGIYWWDRLYDSVNKTPIYYLL